MTGNFFNSLEQLPRCPDSLIIRRVLVPDLGGIMIFWRRKYPLPKFPRTVVSQFQEFCEELPDERVEEFLPEVAECIEHFRELSTQFPILNMQLVERIGEVCVELLKIYPQCSPRHKKMIVGAIRYFASVEDSLSETTYASGLDDDVRVLNHVIEDLKRDDLLIT